MGGANATSSANRNSVHNGDLLKVRALIVQVGVVLRLVLPIVGIIGVHYSAACRKRAAFSFIAAAYTACSRMCHLSPTWSSSLHGGSPTIGSGSL